MRKPGKKRRVGKGNKRRERRGEWQGLPARQGLRPRAQALRRGERDLGLEQRPQHARKWEAGGSRPRGGRAWWAQHPGAVSHFPCPTWLTAPRLGHSPGEGQEETRVCVTGAAGPVKAAPLTVLLQEGGLGWAGLTFSRRGIPRDGGASQPHKAQLRPPPTPGRAQGPSLSVPTCHCPDWLSLAVNSREMAQGKS